MKTEKLLAAAAAAFAERWQEKGYERGESQLFWADLLTNVYGVEDLPSFIRYEERVSSMVDSTNFIDGHIPSTRVLIEQKSLGKDLRAPVTQSDGGKLTPFQQAKKYVANMPLSQHPKWIVTCNFEEFLVYDMERPNGEPEQILLKNLGKEFFRLRFLVDSRSEHLAKELQVSMKAGEIVGKMYDALLERYDDNSPEALRWLNILCVRLVFCMYAEDAAVFRHDQFHDFLNGCSAEDLNEALQKLFSVLNTPLEKRSKYLKDDLKAFPYTNGGLFEEEIEIPIFTEELKQTLLQNASLDFDWSEISPTIFGAVFESTLNPVTRRSGGMHYTSIENIHKVIDPLFLNDLRDELDEILTEKTEKQRVKKLEAYQEKLASLTFLDPACGSGNFLTETYLSLRRLENEALRERYHGQMMMGAFMNPVKVSIHQFYGIEINDFAVTVATTALWISEAQMLAETERIIQHDIDFLPLKSYANIKEGNALRVDWNSIGADASSVAKGGNASSVAEYRTDTTSAVKEGTSDSVALGNGAENVMLGSKSENVTLGSKSENVTLGSKSENVTLGSVTSLHFMERKAYIQITGTKLPHWHQENKVQFVTFRLADSLPQSKLAELSEFKEEWISKHPEPWDRKTEEEYNHIIRKRVDKWLDQNYGSCLLQRADLRKIVVDALLFYHGKRYWLHHFVIMPNHVHLLLSPIGEETVGKALGSVKQFTSNAINKAIGAKGSVWQREVFDRMVRDADNYEAYVAYINNNPANLPQGSFTIGGDAGSVAKGGNASSVATKGASDFVTLGSEPDDSVTLGSEPDDSVTLGSVTSYDYIMGNPPFVGYTFQSKEQKDDLAAIMKGFGSNIDYVAGWYLKASQYMQSNPQTRCALVSTNSITQGEQVSAIWKPLFEKFGIHFDFAYRTFRWDSEADIKAHVHCVVLGFSVAPNSKPRTIYLPEGQSIQVSNINGYLLDAPDVFIENRKKPLCDVPEMVKGSQPTDGGNLILSKAEMEDLVGKYPQIEPYVHRYVGSDEFINNKYRYCLWLANANPAVLRSCPPVMERIERVRQMRLSSPKAATQKWAEFPTLFTENRQPESDYLLVPSVSSENRRYVPIGYMKKDVVASNLAFVVPNASLYHFGVITSNVHMAWMRAVCGRLKSDYRYSNTIVYNNFPWPNPTEKQKAKIEQTAQAILDVRAKYPDCSLADLYDEAAMPPELRKAHQENDKALMVAYGFDIKMSESECVAELFRVYTQFTAES